MAHHQHALVRYVTLDRCLSKLRLSKEELIDRCSEAVSMATGDERRISEKTFFNDIRALREGIVLGRAAPIICAQGRYQYEESGFSLFRSGVQDKEMEELQVRLERLEARAWRVLDLIEAHGVDERLLAEARAILAVGDTCSWAYVAEKEEEAEGRISQAKSAARENVKRSQKAPDEPSEPSGVRMQLPIEPNPPPEGLNADELSRWFLDDFASSYYLPDVALRGWLKRKLFRWRARRAAKSALKMSGPY